MGAGDNLSWTPEARGNDDQRQAEERLRTIVQARQGGDDYSQRLYQPRPGFQNQPEPGPISQQGQPGRAPYGPSGTDLPGVPGGYRPTFPTAGTPDIPPYPGNTPPRDTQGGPPRVPDRPRQPIQTAQEQTGGFGVRNLIELGVMGGSAYYQWQYRMPGLMQDAKIGMSADAAGALETSASNYVANSRAYLNMLEERYKNTVDDMHAAAAERNVRLEDVMRTPESQRAFRDQLPPLQRDRFDTFAQYQREYARVFDTIAGGRIDENVHKIDLTMRPARADIPMNELIGARQPHNPWGVSARSSDALTVTHMNSSANTFETDLRAAAASRATEIGAFHRGVMGRLAVGYGADLLIDHQFFRNSQPGLWTYAADFGASYLGVSRFGWVKTIGGMALAHAFGRGLDRGDGR